VEDGRPRNHQGWVMPGLTVLLVDDHPLFRSGLRALMEREAWVTTVLEAGTMHEAVGTARTKTIDVAVMDIRLPDGDGVLATRRILDAQANVRILVLTTSEDPRWVARALGAGARGYAVKLSDPEVILAAVHTVAYGGVALGPQVDRSALGAGAPAPQVPPPLDRLSGRELEVLTLLASGVSTVAIAQKQRLSEDAVANLMSDICRKLEVADRVQAALLARDHGIGRPLGNPEP
jgi:two-component system, NarL family, nitrate/nitrite response regulator NarL